MRDEPLNFPVVRLEVEYMKHSILHAFTEYATRVDADVKEAVEKFCTPERVKEIIRKAVETNIEGAINEEIARFYRYGSGKDFIARAVKSKLEKDEKFFKDNGLYDR